MKHKHIEASRELRLWLGQIVLPAVAAFALTNPETREKLVRKVTNAKDTVMSKFKK